MSLDDMMAARKNPAPAQFDNGNKQPNEGGQTDQAGGGKAARRKRGGSGGKEEWRIEEEKERDVRGGIRREDVEY